MFHATTDIIIISTQDRETKIFRFVGRGGLGASRDGDGTGGSRVGETNARAQSRLGREASGGPATGRTSTAGVVFERQGRARTAEKPTGTTCTTAATTTAAATAATATARHRGEGAAATGGGTGTTTGGGTGRTGAATGATTRRPRTTRTGPTGPGTATAGDGTTARRIEQHRTNVGGGQQHVQRKRKIHRTLQNHVGRNVERGSRGRGTRVAADNAARDAARDAAETGPCSVGKRKTMQRTVHRTVHPALPAVQRELRRENAGGGGGTETELPGGRARGVGGGRGQDGTGGSEAGGGGGGGAWVGRGGSGTGEGDRTLGGTMVGEGSEVQDRVVSVQEEMFGTGGGRTKATGREGGGEGGGECGAREREREALEGQGNSVEGRTGCGGLGTNPIGHQECHVGHEGTAARTTTGTATGTTGTGQSGGGGGGGGGSGLATTGRRLATTGTTVGRPRTTHGTHPPHGVRHHETERTLVEPRPSLVRRTGGGPGRTRTKGGAGGAGTAVGEGGVAGGESIGVEKETTGLCHQVRDDVEKGGGGEGRLGTPERKCAGPGNPARTAASTSEERKDMVANHDRRINPKGTGVAAARASTGAVGAGKEPQFGNVQEEGTGTGRGDGPHHPPPTGHVEGTTGSVGQERRGEAGRGGESFFCCFVVLLLFCWPYL